ncbi:hypothetical protein AB0M86_41370 [Streptomyces sp. NPDC051639]|uniref:hypothetical protein n=1 Tax=Streptomyces sp. NPDC051639 TaxID=3155671 RepID=UPI003421DF38
MLDRINYRSERQASEGSAWLRRELAMKEARNVLATYGETDEQDAVRAHHETAKALAELVAAIQGATAAGVGQ